MKSIEQTREPTVTTPIKEPRAAGQHDVTVVQWYPVVRLRCDTCGAEWHPLIGKDGQILGWNCHECKTHLL